ncbi:MAG: P63C domain-containing protein, partial [Candidatus Competibacteraceae bacterium]|nr:P63C domain-containing protein [Candidatus Competibacteraceae bacterium]
NDVVYHRLAPGLHEKLQKLNPKLSTGRRKYTHTQWLSDDYGLPELRDHLSNCMFLMDIVLAGADPSYAAFERALSCAKPKIGQTKDLFG